MSTPVRRTLKLHTVEEVEADIRQLFETGYTRAGNWSLGQACVHLSLWIIYPLDGFPPLPFWMRPFAWSLRNSVAPIYTRRVIGGGSIPRRIPAPLGTVPPATTNDRDGVVKYQEQLNRLRNYQGVPYPSPLLGPLTATELVALSCVHAAHHLSFLLPKQ